jgi:3-methyl-2-oxobutanoate hydroxymethyltransferase
MSATPPPAAKPMTVPEFRAAKGRGERLAVVTGYDYTTARLVEAAGVDAVLVGDSVGMVVQGHATSLPVTLGEIVYHTRCVARGLRRPLLVADLPFLSYQVSPRQAVRSAGRLLKAGAAAVKLEGGERMAEHVAACTRADIPVMGHVGLTPQSVHRMGGFRVQRDADQAVADAKAVAAAGAFAIVVEGVPAAVGAAVTAAVDVPTIGIGAGPGCDGQVLVLQDLLGLFGDFRPKFVKRYADLGTATVEAVAAYCREVRTGAFPAAEHTFK